MSANSKSGAGADSASALAAPTVRRGSPAAGPPSGGQAATASGAAARRAEPGPSAPDAIKVLKKASHKVPAPRPAKVARARRLIQQANYPSPEIMQQVARKLARIWKQKD